MGGGLGLTRHYLTPEVAYTVLDPSLPWLADDWQAIAPSFPALLSRPNFVRGLAEYLPFKDRSFEVVLSLWTLNHISRVRVAEAHRVLVAGGRFAVVLEDMPPRWSDLLARVLSPPFSE